MITRPSLPMTSMACNGTFMLAIAWLATRRMTGAELGFFFSFLSLAALVPLADFGLSYAALQTAGRLAGEKRLAELPAVARRVALWNLAASGLAAATTAVLGWTLFSGAPSGPPATAASWGGPWLAYVLGAFLSQLATPGIALREGSGRVSEMWRLRLAQEWAGGVACLVTLQAGGGLYSLSALALARAAVAAVGLALSAPVAAGSPHPAFPLGRWMSEIWPFQWRIGLSGLSGFLIFRAFVPIVFAERGPDLAGRFGLAVALMNLLIAVSSAWPMSQAARYAAGIAGGEYEALRREFPALLVRSTALAAAAAAASAAALWWCREAGLIFALHLPDPTTTALVLAAAVAHHIVLSGAMFLRAEGKEPLVVPSVLGALATALSLWIAARYGGPTAIAGANLLFAALGIPVVFVLLRRRARRRYPPGPAGDGGDR